MLIVDYLPEALRSKNGSRIKTGVVVNKQTSAILSPRPLSEEERCFSPGNTFGPKLKCVEF